MKSKLSNNRRLKLIEEILQGKTVSKVAGGAGVSKTLFHKWLRRYKERGEEGLKPLTPGRPRKSRTPKKLGSPKPLFSLERLRMVQEVLEDGKSAGDVAKKYGVSRVTLYKWINRFKEEPDKRLAAVEDKKREVSHYFRQTPDKYEDVILNLVAQHPEYGVRRILLEVPKIGGRPIIGHHGIQNVLSRHSLATYEQRLAYAQGQITPVTRLITQILGFASRFFAIPQVPRARIVRFGAIAALSMFTTVVIFGLGGYFAQTFVSVSLSTKIGLIFATVALGFGSIFFLYSLKYYLSLAIVLSFSQTESAQNIEQRTKGSGFLGWILGLRPRRAYGQEGEGRRAIGLEPNLEHIKLERYPKISVHVPLYNEKNVVERLLSSVTSFDYPGDPARNASHSDAGGYEVIIADDSTDETTKIALQFLKGQEGKLREIKGNKGIEIFKFTPSNPHKPSLTLIHRSNRSGFKGGALREALKHTDPKAEFVTVFDADFVPYPDTLELFLKYFSAVAEAKADGQATGELKSLGNIAAVQGYQWHVLNKSENWITRGVRSEYAGSYVIERSGAEIYTGLKQISGAVYMIRRDVLEEIGWQTSITEDFELTLKLYEKGYKVVYTPYIQAPAECVSTLKRLIRQRMRWAEGHSNNIRRMFTRLLFGRWVDADVVNDQFPISNLQSNSNDSMTQTKEFENLDIENSLKTENSKIENYRKKWIPSPLTLSEKLEFLYLSPYYLQAFFFLVGTISWLISEAIFPARLPFWTSLWGWSLVLTNMLSLPLMNAVGLFLEESEERDYLGLASFFAMSYILVPFQAYAAVKGFIQKEEGPWFRTPKTGKITDIFTRGKFYRFISGILPGRVAPAMRMNANGNSRIFANNSLSFASSPYLGLATANNQFDSFRIRPKRMRWYGKVALVFVLTVSLFIHSLAFRAAPVEATWYNASWQFRKSITIDYTKVSSGPHTSFPVLISLASDTDLAADAQDDGDDILFTSSDEITKLDHEIETFNGTSGLLVAWVRVPSLSSVANTILYMYYGNAAAANQQNATGVWDANFKSVWHINTSSWLDSTSAGNTLTASGNPTTGTGKVGTGLVLDGTGDWLRGNYSNFDNASAGTYEFWLYYDTAVSADGFLTSDNVQPHIFNSGGTTLRIYIDSTSGRVYDWNVNGSLSTGVWMHFVVTVNSTIARLYKNDTEIGQDSTPAYTLDRVTNTVYIGTDRAIANRDVDGTMDEVRISNVVRSAGWILTDYNNQNSPSTFYSLGTEEEIPEFLALLLPVAVLAPAVVKYFLGRKKEWAAEVVKN